MPLRGAVPYPPFHRSPGSARTRSVRSAPGALKRRAGWISRSEIPAPPAFEARGLGRSPRERAKGG
ncbi:hypothetical protein Slala02_69640 [Streptomyces lavendulae subsp. lavendulae]|nr:hypothetical protein Slala02_69640 [Streptomyces lavendulae subsp. lavendulae]